MNEPHLFPNHNLSSWVPSRSDALTKSDFLFPTTDIDSLINDSTFTQTIGCSNSSQNLSCINTCGNVTNLFSSWPNFYSCSWYPALAEALSDPNLNNTQVAGLDAKGISGNDSSFPTNISNTIATCLNDYCQSSPDCLAIDTFRSCSLDNLLSSNGSSQELNRTSAFICMSKNVCSTTASINPDIGGLGVILSLMIQYSLSIGAFILQLFFEFKYRVTKRRWETRGDTESSIKRIAKAKQSRTEHLEALTSAVVEFQKSQCFFAATLQIASLIVLQTFQVGEHRRDAVLLHLTAANAFAPIVLTLAHIELLGGRSSTYVLLLSMLTYVLGTAAYWVSLPDYSGGFLYRFYENPVAPVMSCGNLAPFAPCYRGNEFYYNGFWEENSGVYYSASTGFAVWIITSGIMLYRLGFAVSTKVLDLEPVVKTFKLHGSRLCLAVLNLLKSFKYTARVLSFCERSPPVQTFTKACHSVLEFLEKPKSWLYIQILYGAIAVIIQFASVIQVFILSSNIIATQMSFGQIVAVGIWVPVLLEYGYLEINGAKEGNEYRLKSPLVVGVGPVVSGQGNGSSGGTQAQSASGVNAAAVPGVSVTSP